MMHVLSEKFLIGGRAWCKNSIGQTARRLEPYFPEGSSLAEYILRDQRLVDTGISRGRPISRAELRKGQV